MIRFAARRSPLTSLKEVALSHRIMYVLYVCTDKYDIVGRYIVPKYRICILSIYHVS